MIGRKKLIKILKIIIVFLAFCVVVGVVVGILLVASANPPINVINKCQREIAIAREAEADKYAPHVLVSAENSFQLAMNEWKYQNERIFFIRNYRQMLGLAREATDKAKEASDLALHIKDSLQSGLGEKLKNVRYKLDHFDSNYAYLPLSGTTRQNFTTAKLRYMESKEAYERGDFKQVGINLDVASQLITKSVAEAHSYLSNYFEGLSKWRRWADETMAWSRNNDAPVIIIDKFAQKCYVYHDGKLKKNFMPNWARIGSAPNNTGVIKQLLKAGIILLKRKITTRPNTIRHF